MRKMFSKNQIEEMSRASTEALIESGDINEDIAAALEDEDVSVGSLDAEGLITGGEIVEKMTGYAFTEYDSPNVTENIGYAGAVKNGNKLTFAVSGTIQVNSTFLGNGGGSIFLFTIPEAVGQKLIPSTIDGQNDILSFGNFNLIETFTSYKNAHYRLKKNSNSEIAVVLLTSGAGISADTDYYFRFEQTFLLNENLAE